ncbi:MAG: hypothetical protein AAFO94_16990, partial [Bacteroidota bacterium]
MPPALLTEVWMYSTMKNDMENNYKINLNPEEPSSEQIAAHKDFDALLRKTGATTGEPPTTQQGASVRYIRLLSAAAAAALIGVLFYFGLSSNEQALPSAESYFAARPYVNPPLPQATPAFATIKVDANEGGVYEYKSGSRLVVPRAAFMDDRGSLISGEVELKYREY